MTKRKNQAKGALREALKTITPPLMWDFLRRLKNHQRKYYGVNNLDKKIEKYLGYTDGFFVELGANDGIRQSNTLFFERCKNWRGILVEPTPHNYFLCLSNRSTRTRIFCNACTSFDYKKRFVEIAFSDLMSCPIGLESDIDDPIQHANEGKRFLKDADEVIAFGALATPLNTLLLKARAPQTIDLLSLDVEGAEIEVLKGIDHTQFRFKYICVESRDIDKISNYLKSVGYKLIEKLSQHDYLFTNAHTNQ